MRPEAVPTCFKVGEAPFVRLKQNRLNRGRLDGQADLHIPQDLVTLFSVGCVAFLGLRPAHVMERTQCSDLVGALQARDIRVLAHGRGVTPTMMAAAVWGGATWYDDPYLPARRADAVFVLDRDNRSRRAVLMRGRPSLILDAGGLFQNPPRDPMYRRINWLSGDSVP